MAHIPLNKSALNGERSKLKIYSRFLPALDLKRRQLMAELIKCRRQLSDTREEMQVLRQTIEQQLPMLADRQMKLDNLLVLEHVIWDEENVVGVRLPRFSEARFETTDYSMLMRPHWVDNLVLFLREQVVLALREKIEIKRVALLKKALRKTTQRLNLFEKVLIPRTRSNIRKISIFLSDAERAGVVRAKITKRKQKGAGH